MHDLQRPFDRDGFAVLPEALNAAEVAELSEIASQLAPVRVRAGIRHLMHHTGVSSLAHDPRVLGFAQRMLGPEAFPFRATLLDKSPGRNWLIAWHQDTALPLLERRELTGWGPWSLKDGITYAHAPAAALHQVVALRIHLDDSMSENGPLRVLPGTHTGGILSDDEIHSLSTRIPEVNCVVGRGGILAMRPLLIHASSKSRTKAARRVLHIEYAANPGLEGLRLAVV
jgi:hypothetical protein